MASTKKRIALMDELRGFCVLCMIFYHSFITLGDFFGFQWATDAYEFFMPAQPYFAGTFIVLCGVSSRLSHSNTKRGLLLLLIALAISFITIEIMPSLGFSYCEIYFGILHLLSVSILFFALCHKALDKIPAAIGGILSLILAFVFRGVQDGFFGLVGDLTVSFPDSFYETNFLFPLGFLNTAFFSADYFPILPWLFVFLFGAYLGVYITKNSLPSFMYTSRIKFLDFLGKHALIIFILHQPVIFCIGYLFEFIIEKASL